MLEGVTILPRYAVAQSLAFLMDNNSSVSIMRSCFSEVILTFILARNSHYNQVIL
jgi:hypothetical protein